MLTNACLCKATDSSESLAFLFLKTPSGTLVGRVIYCPPLRALLLTQGPEITVEARARRAQPPALFISARRRMD